MNESSEDQYDDAASASEAEDSDRSQYEDDQEEGSDINDSMALTVTSPSCDGSSDSDYLVF